MGCLYFFCVFFTCDSTGIARSPEVCGRQGGIISDIAEKGLNGYLQELEQKTGAQMIVLTIDTTGDIPIETYAIELATKWKLGQKGKDNGVLVVVAKDDPGVSD